MKLSSPRMSILLFLMGAGLQTVVHGQTPEQAQLWEQQRQQALADERAKSAVLEHDRAARRADPMAWVRTLDPLTAGGWEFRAVSSDGSWAAYATRHQLKRSGAMVTVWLRQEYAEPQTGSSGRYSSAALKVQYDCAKERVRTLMAIYYGDNNVHGSEQTEEADAKTAAWQAIVPGTRDESNFLWACNVSDAKPPP